MRESRQQRRERGSSSTEALHLIYWWCRSASAFWAVFSSTISLFSRRFKGKHHDELVHQVNQFIDGVYSDSIADLSQPRRTRRYSATSAELTVSTSPPCRPGSPSLVRRRTHTIPTPMASRTQGIRQATGQPTPTHPSRSSRSLPSKSRTTSRYTLNL